MKIKIAAILIAMALSLSLTGCSNNNLHSTQDDNITMINEVAPKCVNCGYQMIEVDNKFYCVNNPTCVSYKDLLELDDNFTEITKKEVKEELLPCKQCGKKVIKKVNGNVEKYVCESCQKQIDEENTCDYCGGYATCPSDSECVQMTACTNCFKKIYFKDSIYIGESETGFDKYLCKACNDKQKQEQIPKDDNSNMVDVYCKNCGEHRIIDKDFADSYFGGPEYFMCEPCEQQALEYGAN